MPNESVPSQAAAEPQRSSSGESLVTWREALPVWARIAALSFGGPTGQIAVIHRLLVEEKRWISENRFLHALNYCMLLPGPEAQQLATYAGWLMHGLRGGLVAGGLFILPGAVSLLLLSVLYVQYRSTNLVQGTLYGLKAAVLAVVLEAVLRIGKRVLKNGVMYAVAAAAFVAIFFFNVPFPAIVAAAALIGLSGGLWRPDLFLVVKPRPAQASGVSASYLISDESPPAGAAPTVLRTLTTIGVWGVIWWLPVALVAWQFGTQSAFFQQGVFFSKAALVTFGGAYAVLPYVAQQAVEKHRWVTAGEMLDGLGMAETTPGPLIIVLQFVGFLGAYRSPGGLDPVVAGIVGSAITTWVTFAPSFLFIFAGAPWIERLRDNKSLGTALSAVTAAVVGVVLNLAVWFALQTLVHSDGDSSTVRSGLPLPGDFVLDLAALGLAIAAGVALIRYHANLFWVLGLCLAAGWFLSR